MLMYDMTRHLEDPVFNVDGSAHGYSEQFGARAMSLLHYVHVLCVSKSQLPNAATANVPSHGHTIELDESCHLLSLPSPARK